MPRSPPRRHSDDDILVIEEVGDARNRRISSSSSSTATGGLPPGIEELESLYAPMRNLMQPLPNAKRYSGVNMPLPHPLSPDWTGMRMGGSRQDDQESEVCSVIADIPPLLAPVQSHAVLEESLGHEIPRTPMRQQKWSKGTLMGTPTAPPTLPKRLSQHQQRPSHLNLQQQLQQNVKPDSVIYANGPNRSSLMSTGSSENSSESSTSSLSIPGVAPETPVSPNAPVGEEMFSSWTNYSRHGWSPVAPVVSAESPVSDHEHRSVSQLGDPIMDSSAISEEGLSGVYVKMNKPSLFPAGSTDKESHYMNILYNAVQRQGGAGSVESAMSPYMAMTANRTTAGADSNVIYAQPSPNKRRVRSNSASRLSEISSLMRRSKSSSTGKVHEGSGSSRSRAAVIEFKELMQEVDKKRHFRVGLNLFNSKPDLGVEYLVQRDFLELSPSAVAKFLRDNTGLSKDKVGEYLGNLQSPFSMKVLSCFMQEFNFARQRIDKSLRQLLGYVRVPGEAQKIERIMEEFGKRYNKCNPGFAAKLESPDSVVTLSFAAMLLNTDLHSPSMKEEKKMSLEDFMQNLRGVDSGKNFDSKLLKSMYKSIKKQEFLGGVDHVLQTQLIQQSIQGPKRPNLAEPHRRLVCVCRLYEVADLTSSRTSQHQRDVYLFNDVMVTTKQSSAGRKSSKSSSNNGPVFAYRSSFELKGVEVNLFQTPVHRFGIQIGRKGDPEPLIILNAGSEHDRYKFVTDLQESIFEMDLMESVLRRDNL
jgi:hypothetical protein